MKFHDPRLRGGYNMFKFFNFFGWRGGVKWGRGVSCGCGGDEGGGGVSFGWVGKLPPPLGSHVFQRTGTIFELNSLIIGTNLLTKFHEDWTRNVASRVLTRKTALPTGSHVFERTGTTFELYQHIIKTNILTNFELDRDIIGINLLTEFHEDRTRNVAARVFTNQMWTTDKDRLQKIT
ncbi:hypothetical protein DPMN_010909 [Dreissena polymorpha]|uniref:Uncharacterized protein n=1 Tax=Dreissena polymorpha TaxID=45954 RepID=A0A9D4N2L2_DREPO|nr:hypothetical protein DPMN_010909 [Dreissena polymorpha]